MGRVRGIFAVILWLAVPLSAHCDISAFEAQKLATTYMICHVTGCGGITEPVALGAYWNVPLRFGVAGTPRGAIRVDRTTGVVSYNYAGKHYPNRTPKQLHEEEYRLVHGRR
jgi:hypothetical protein